jgi:hypothetical protein
VSHKRIALVMLVAVSGCRDWDKLAQDCTVENGCIRAGAGGGSGGPTVPAPPTAVTAEAQGLRAVRVKWSPPANTGGSAITGYTVKVESSSPVGPSRSASASAEVTEATVIDLENGTTYTFVVRALNDIGPSGPSVESNAVTTPAVPGASTSVTATAADKAATVTWTAPANVGGSPVSGYTVTSVPGGLSGSTTGATTLTLTGLTNGTSYTFNVVATNLVGDGPPAASNAVTPSGPPGAPTGVTATAGNTEAMVQWGPPADNGGSAITGYTVTSTPGNFTATTTGATQAMVTGLTNGTSYTFSVTATNVRGTGPATTSNAVVPNSVPGSPTSVTATAGNALAMVQWTAPANNGGSAISGYTVTSNPGGLTATTNGITTQASVTGLTNGTQYEFTVTATNLSGVGLPSVPSNKVIPATVPDPPTAVTAMPGNSAASVQWSPPVSNGGSVITGYSVLSSPGGFSATTTGATQVNVVGLTNGTAYTFTVKASNALGPSVPSASSNSVTPLNVPDPPTNVSATAGNTQATVQWTPGNAGGSAITGFTVTSDPGSVTANVGAGATQATVTGLLNGTAYTFKVIATNSAGPSVPSGPSSPVTPDVLPLAPVSVSATPGNMQATVSWSAPPGNGGTPVVSYTVSSTPGGFTATTANGTTTTATVTGLTNAVSYTFTVRATNGAGSGPASVASNPVTPATPPGPPSGVSAIAQDQAALVQWSAPASNGGSAITGYTATSSPGGYTGIASGSSTSTTVAGLSNGTPYTFTVTATNAVGTGGPSSASSALIPFGVPGVPSAFWADGGRSMTAGEGFAVVQWTPPSNNGNTITSYDVRSSPGNFGGAFSGAPATINGLTVGTTYSFTARAINDAGMGNAAVSNAVIPLSVPGAPTGVSADGGNAQATVGWLPPAITGGTSITSYTVTSSPGNLTASSTTPDATVTGLMNGSPYMFTVKATNAVGAGPASSASNSVTPATVPAAPTNVRAIPGNVQAAVSWQPPSNNGGNPITGYAVSSTPAGFTATTGTTYPDGGIVRSVQATGVSNGVSYVFNVQAINAKGTGAAGVSTPVKPCAAAGTFSDGGTYGVALSAGLGDFNADGKLDLLVTTAGNTSNLGVRLGNGNGTFAASAPQGGTSDYNVIVPAIGDIDGDGKMDVVVPGGSNSPRVFWADSAGSGSLAPIDLATTGAVIVGAAIGDFNNDGRRDVVTLPRSAIAGENFTVYLRDNTAPRTFPTVVPTVNPKRPSGGFVVADFNSDGKLDLAFSVSGVSGQHGVQIMYGDGAGSFMAGTYVLNATVTPTGLATGDFNFDGKADLAVGSWGSTSQVAILTGNGLGGFVTTDIETTGNVGVRGLVTGDFNGDGRLDIAAVTDSGVVSIYAGNGDGTLQAGVVVRAGQATGAFFPISLGDLNGSGALSIVVPSDIAPGLQVLSPACGP